MKQQLSKLQDNDEETKLLTGFADLLEDWEDVKRVLQYQELLYILEIIRSKGDKLSSQWSSCRAFWY